MSPARLLAGVAAALALCLPAAGYAPAPLPTNRVSVSRLAGRWTVTFANGVVETCEVRRDGTASVTEPRRSSPGRARAKGGAVVITFNDDRVERWSVRDGRVVVEHWFPGSQYPSGTRVRGVARRSR
jgi:hypothetical protein